MRTLLIVLALSSSCWLNAQREFVQQILLDKPVDAGPLKVFPDLSDGNKYYYLPNKFRLAQDENGRPKFTFLRYVTNVRSASTDEKERTVGNGGGYVHLMMGLHVLPDELATARQELKRINPRGVIMGPVVYKGGTMALITKSVITNSSGSNPDPEQKRVLGIGPAPVMEGDNVAVSFVLDSLDATILWETLKSPTPDLSFNLNMMLSGYQSPVSFTIVMFWDKIYKHKIFNAGLATPILKTEIGIATQELQEKGDLLIEKVGEDADLQKLQDVITNKLLEMCFIPFGSEGSPNWAELAKPMNDGKSYLDRATESLNNERLATERRNKDIQDRNMKERQYADEENRKRRAENLERRKIAQAEAAAKKKEADDARKKAAAETDPAKKTEATEDAKMKEEEAASAQELEAAETDLNEKMTAAEEARQAADGEKDATKKAALEKTAQEKEKERDDAQAKVDALRSEEADPNTAFEQPTRVKPTTGSPDGLGPAFTDPKNYKDASKPIEDVAETVADIKKEEEMPNLAIVASYQQKKIRHSGTYRASAKTYYTTSLNEPFAGNIGKINCRDCIREINTETELYKQRELLCFLDGDIAQVFDRYINYVTVQMRKRHPAGDISMDEIQVNRTTINREGNKFRLMYGWKPGDNDRRTWLNYEYKTTWNFFGGTTIVSDWQASDALIVPMSAPVVLKTVSIVATPEKIAQNNIRSVSVKIYYKIGAQEQVKQIGLLLSKQVFSNTVDFMLPRGVTDYEYEVEWLQGTKPVKSARIKTSLSEIFVDEIQ